MFLLIIVQFIIVFTAYFTYGENVLKTINPEIIKQDLEVYRNNLLNENSLKFLTKCYDVKCCMEDESILCPSYFELVRLYKVNNINISDQLILKQINQSSLSLAVNIKEFCEKFPSHIPNTSYYDPQHQQENVLKTVSDPGACKILCSKIELLSTSTQKLKPLCYFISWLSEKLNLEKNVVKNTTTKNTNSVVIPSLNKPASVLIDSLKNLSTQLDAVINNSLNVSTTIKSPSTPSVSKIDKNEIIKNSFTSIDTNTKIEKNTVIKSSTEILNDDIKITDNNEQKQDGSSYKIVSNVVNKSQETDANFLKNEEDLNAYSEENDSEPDINTNMTYKSSLLNQVKNPEIEEVNDDIERTLYKENLLSTDPFYEKSGSNFFFYFLMLLFISILIYVIYQNKTKILALLIEGRRSQKTKNRRKSSARYKRLDTTLEEAIISGSTGHNTTQVIY